MLQGAGVAVVNGGVTSQYSHVPYRRHVMRSNYSIEDQGEGIGSLTP